MKPICDYHMHTPLCGHAIGEPARYVNHAIEVGLQEIGFSDHAPFVVRDLPGITMTMDELPQYYRMIEAVQAQYKNDISVRMGIEADFIPGYEEKTKKILDDYPYDYVIGSVHFIKEWGFDDPAERVKWDEQDVNQVYRDYYDLLRQSAQTGLFNIMAHVDLVKKFGHQPTESLNDEIEKTAKVFKECGVVIEINSSGLRKQAKEMYPALNALKIYAANGVPLTFGSDAHQPDHVGCDFDKALQLAKDAGYLEYAMFENRQITKTIPIE
jgi:histidinol-phosphatase (PHP family)